MAGLQKNVSGQKVRVFAFDRTDNTPKTGDAANITGKVAKDWAAAAAITDTNPTEVEDGYYLFDLTQAETNADVLDFYPESSTADVQVIAVPGTVFTAPPNFAALGIESDGDVTQVNTCVTNSDMVGTDGAYTGTPPTAAAVADAVLDEALSGHTTAGTLGKALADVEADTNELQSDDVPGLIAALDTVVDRVETDTQDLQTQIGTAGAGLTDLGGMSTAMKAEVNAEADTALADYGANTTTPPTAAAIADQVWDEAKAGHVGAGSFGEEVQNHALSSELPSEPPTAAAIADAVWDEAIAGHAGSGSTGEALTNANAPTAAAVADAVWEEAIGDHSSTSGSTAEAVSNASAPTAAAVADAVWTEAIADHSGTGGSTAEALSAAGGSSGLREIKGTATYNSATKELRVLAWLELSAVVQDATAATLSFKNDAGTEVLADGSFTKAENTDNTWLWTITDGSAINAVKNYMATITFTVGGTDYTRTMALAGQGA